MRVESERERIIPAISPLERFFESFASIWIADKLAGGATMPKGIEPELRALVEVFKPNLVADH